MGKLRITINPEYENNRNVLEFIRNLPQNFDTEGITLYNKRNVIKCFTIDATNNVLCAAVVKRYKHPSYIQRIVYSFFRKSKAYRAFHNATELRRRGVYTPKEIACVEQWHNGLFEYGYYISGSDDAPPIREKLVEPQDFDRTMAADFAAFAANLHEKGILHHDLNSTNVLYHPSNDGHYSFSVIDINRMDFMPEGEIPSRADCFENMTRFTGRMDLFEYVLRHYVEKRGWDIEEAVKEAIAVKNKHDEQWRRRKAFLRKLKPKKK